MVGEKVSIYSEAPDVTIRTKLLLCEDPITAYTCSGLWVEVSLIFVMLDISHNQLTIL